jgi:hypothetical protein
VARACVCPSRGRCFRALRSAPESPRPSPCFRTAPAGGLQCARETTTD